MKMAAGAVASAPRAAGCRRRGVSGGRADGAAAAFTSAAAVLGRSFGSKTGFGASASLSGAAFRRDGVFFLQTCLAPPAASVRQRRSGDIGGGGCWQTREHQAKTRGMGAALRGAGIRRLLLGRRHKAGAACGLALGNRVSIRRASRQTVSARYAGRALSRRYYRDNDAARTARCGASA